MSKILFQEQTSLNFMAAFTIHSDFGAQENEICYSYHLSPCCFSLGTSYYSYFKEETNKQ